MNSFKKLFAVLLLASGVGLTTNLFARGNSAGALLDPDNRADDIYVYNADTVAHEVGDVVVYYDGTVLDGLEITTTVVANNSLVAGVVVGKTIDSASWGYIRRSGYCSAITVTGTVTAGDQITTSTTGEAGRAYTVADSTGSVAGQGDDYGVYATALSSDSGGTVKGFIHAQ